MMDARGGNVMKVKERVLAGGSNQLNYVPTFNIQNFHQIRSRCAFCYILRAS